MITPHVYICVLVFGKQKGYVMLNSKSICRKVIKPTKSPKSDEFHQNRVFNKFVSSTVNLGRVQIARPVC
jgi:hypothetical protein